jgi:hypothetical protein
MPLLWIRIVERTTRFGAAPAAILTIVMVLHIVADVVSRSRPSHRSRS